MKFKFSSTIATVASILVLSQSSYSFQKSPSEITQDITVLIDGCGLGSGVIFKQEKNSYLVLTARHVLREDVDCLVITSDRERYTAKKNKFTYYQGLDLVAMEFESNQSYPVGKLGKSEEVTMGNTVYVAGAPASNQTITKRDILVTEGKIIRTTSELELGYTLVYDNTTKKGMSGGPVVDENGEVIGIHGRRNSAEGIQESYGIPIQKFLTEKIGQNLEDYYLLQGNAFLDEGNYEEAKTAYKKVIEINPNYAAAYFYLGFVNYKLEDKESAIADYNKAIEINPNYADAYYNRGVARSALGDQEGAIADYNK
ncbi:MAG TPA: hypothetical protein DEG17_03310, partial [Cyanobacteria bacterium UBA11149]|nr:hypothetical protein [Cyanobacteria bacterium UBA11366]HBR77014.1 hypothetical protein [Cyanobacteria bacterium UBA11159]HBW87935.1 hypothetical protein [Cyanobacteria bacterium UBA11149]